MKRVYHHYELWQETKWGMWRRPAGQERAEWIKKAAEFMADTARFESAMNKVVEDWSTSCEVNFTTKSINRQAWLGHAATCLAIGCPEEPTRAAWWTLTENQRNLADDAAARAIVKWERYYAKRKKCQNQE